MGGNLKFKINKDGFSKKNYSMFGCEGGEDGERGKF